MMRDHPSNEINLALRQAPPSLKTGSLFLRITKGCANPKAFQLQRLHFQTMPDWEFSVAVLCRWGIQVPAQPARQRPVILAHTRPRSPRFALIITLWLS